MSTRWRERNRPSRLEGRYEFTDYATLSDFLEQAGALSERVSLFPDIGFGRNYVNFTIASDDGADAPGAGQRDFADQLDALFAAQADP